MSAEQIVNDFIKAIENHDVEGAVTMVAEDVSYENMPMNPIVGREAVRQTLAGFLERATEVDWVINSQWAVGSTVINERVDRFKIGESWLELPVAGFFEVDEDGLITLWRDYFDLGSYMNQLAALTS